MEVWPWRDRGVALGGLCWLAAYALMLWVHVETQLVVWPLLPWAAYSLVWEWLDALGFLGQSRAWKRVLHLVFAVLDTALCWSQITQKPREAAVWLSVFVVIALARPREFKYGHFVWQFGEHWAMVHLPAFQTAPHPMLVWAAWLQVLGSAMYVGKAQDAPPRWRWRARVAATTMPLACAAMNVFCF